MHKNSTKSSVQVGNFVEPKKKKSFCLAIFSLFDSPRKTFFAWNGKD